MKILTKCRLIYQSKKQNIISKNSSQMSREQLQLLKSMYYLQLSQVNALKGYKHLLLGEDEDSKHRINKALKICVKQYYGSKKGKKFIDDLILSKNEYHHFFCNFHTYDTYDYLIQNDEMDAFNLHYFIKTIKLRWIVREYIFKYSHDLSLLFPKTK